MIVRAVKTFRAPVFKKSRGPQRQYREGDQYEVSPELGEFLVREGLCEPASRSTERKVVDAGAQASGATADAPAASDGSREIPEGWSVDETEPRLLKRDGSSWFMLPNGDKVNGRSNALASLD